MHNDTATGEIPIATLLTALTVVYLEISLRIDGFLTENRAFGGFGPIRSLRVSSLRTPPPGTRSSWKLAVRVD